VSTGPPADILIGPRTTVYALLQTYPFLEPFLLARVRGFERLAEPRARLRWARVMTMQEVAVRLDVSWQRLVGEIASEVERTTGRTPRVADAPRRIVGDERRLGELRDVVAGLEAGASLLEMAERWRSVTADLVPAETAALEAALSGEAAGGQGAGTRAVRSAAETAEAVSPPPGHPLELLRREAGQLRELCRALEAELDRSGGSPSRRRWRRERAHVVGLVDGLAAVELRYRRERQAWFPALSVHGVGGPQALLTARQDAALETLRRLRLAADRDDPASVAEAAVRLLTEVGDLLAQDERLLEPLALRHFSAGDWAAVRELEDAVGWALTQKPPPWPSA
jgi:hypothetical protein